MSGVEHVAGYLIALAEALPAPGRLFTLHAVERGSDVQGWTRALCLTLPGVEPIYLEGDDLEKPVDQLVRETVEIVHRAAAVKRGLAANTGSRA